MKMPRLLCRIAATLFLSFALFPRLVFAQGDIPLGNWRMHISFNQINSIAIGNQKVYAAARNGVMVFDRADNSITTYSKLDGLKGQAITSIAYDVPSQTLLIAYENGVLDIVDSQNVITSLDPTKNSSLTGSKKINNITVHDNLAYLAADYGVVLFDVRSKQVKETWRDLGATGETLKILQSAFTTDSVFLATGKGVIAGSLDDNLLDFNNWKRFDTGDFNAPIQSVASVNEKVYAAINASGIFEYGNGSWTKETFLQGATFQSLNSTESTLIIAQDDKVWTLSTSNALSLVADKLITHPSMALLDAGKLWIGDALNGLVTNANGPFIRFVPNSPVNATAVRLTSQNQVMYAAAGGHTTDFKAQGNPGMIDMFQQGSWAVETTALQDLTDVAYIATTQYVSSFGWGVQRWDEQGAVTLYDETNSPLVNTAPPDRHVNITSLAVSEDGLWVANYGAAQPLHLLKSDNTWQSFSFTYAPARFPTKLVTDLYGSVWMVLNPDSGGGLVAFNKSKSVYLTNIAGAGGLPSKAVRSIAVDRDGLVWVGTDQGVAYFIDPYGVYDGAVDAIKPIFDDRFLLKDDKVTAIAVDGGNRKWMGTERGVWLFGPDGQSQVYNFTTANSPLLSNVIRDIAIDGKNGEVFFATDEGIVSFRADATESTSTFQTVKIFPNPVSSEFAGTVGITGLATDAIVKITDITGKLIWQTQANGGTASWNTLDYTGKRPSTGIYLVFSATPDGAESVVGKIAFVD
ncbi:Por secretion system C-terminal sorting domain-containing protein [Chryseolinea serpens]|uniref:Por secretion system C-terminal sorting domain-containing protein n=2 Tax=Chryseolinea serpens TaxID=947013 RepID=A0A1M5PAK5_9BACT|nr:Por secretion system C-terminal sorting domain-containing protein [Chryseolinea serpens]